MGQPVVCQKGNLHASQELRKRPSQGQRFARQPDRDSGGRCLEGGRHGGGALRSRRLRAIRADSERVRAAQSVDNLSL